MPSHIIVNSLGLTYKGTIGMSTATIPDVCKTPSPAGPVPIPYPNIASQSTLQNGTTTVKAKGQMIAVKGSQYSSSNGDEAGTAGGVKSGVNMKATDWITYSFDVKFDGKNACRHTDKLFHNNQNAANLAGGIDPLAGGGNPLEIKCDGAPESSKKKFSKCQQNEICAKCKSLNKMAADPNCNMSRTAHKKKTHKKRRRAGNDAARGAKTEARAMLADGKKGTNLPFQADDPDCQKKLKKQAEDNNYKGFSTDHVHEIQIGGHPTDTGNLKWMTSRTNSWIGGVLKQFDPNPPVGHTGVKPDCC